MHGVLEITCEAYSNELKANNEGLMVVVEELSQKNIEQSTQNEGLMKNISSYEAKEKKLKFLVVFLFLVVATSMWFKWNNEEIKCNVLYIP